MNALTIVPPIPLVAVALTGAIYMRGWFLLHRQRPLEFPVWHVSSFVAALCMVLIALSSPMDHLADGLLIFHMTQHIVLMSVIPPLIALGSPSFPLLRGSPRWFRRVAVAPVHGSPVLRRIAAGIATPVPTVLAVNLVFVGWHFPALYELALRSEAWHAVEHLCFLSASLLFWWKIVDPIPSRHVWSPWTKVACLVFADVVNTAVSAYLSFSGKVIYPTYEHATTKWGLTAIADQSAAGAEMWVVNSVAFLIPAMIIPLRALAPSFTRCANLNSARPQPADLAGS